MRNLNLTVIAFIVITTLFQSCNASAKKGNAEYVNCFIGTGGNARVVPAASVPYGMIQIGPDTRRSGGGYQYEDPYILGFSHVHKSGGGCADFLDILFMPLSSDENPKEKLTLNKGDYKSGFSHTKESARPGFYSVDLYDGEVNVSLTTSKHSSVQKYRYSERGSTPFLIDLEHGSTSACTIEAEHDCDTVYSSLINIVDKYTIKGYRNSNGWVTGQQVYFFTTFSSPIKEAIFYIDNKQITNSHAKSAEGRNVKVIILFEDNQELIVKSGISAVDMEGAEKNMLQEVKDRSFNRVSREATEAWNRVLNKIDINTTDVKKREIFYTSLFNVMKYPMLFSDVDSRFRSGDGEIHTAEGYNNYSAVVGFWDTFRAACPLLSVLAPDIMLDYVKTSLDHYKYHGQLPIWTLWGYETYQMIGIHAMPVITNAYMNGITNFDTKYALEAMVKSAMKDSCGESMGYFVGLRNYMEYGYIPCDMEMEATARTLEYAYDDWAISQFALLTSNQDQHHYFKERSQNYRNVIDTSTLFARGRYANGTWKEPFNPRTSSHRNDEYCEGNAWQWTFFVPHDVEGLAEIMGGKKALIARLDSLFTTSSTLEGANVSGDISGLIGQYAHGNEPGHHTIFMYNIAGEPQKTQYYTNKVINELYDNTPTGICGNEDTGQMSAWYVFVSMGLYPLDPASGKYELTCPQVEESTINLPNGKKFSIKAVGMSEENIYIKSVTLNGKPLGRTFLTFDEVNNGGECIIQCFKGV